MNITCTCGKQYQSKIAPCPDGIAGCLVLYYAKNAHVCPACGKDNIPDLSKGVAESIGIGAFNLKGLTRLSLYRGEDIDILDAVTRGEK